MVTENFEDIILKRRDELEFEIGDSDLDEVKINNVLRDEFSDEKYSQALLDLGIDEEIEQEDVEDEKDLNLSDDSTGGDKLLSILLISEEKLQETEMRLRNYKKVRGKWVRKQGEASLLPSEDIEEIMLFLIIINSPQNLLNKLTSETLSFTDSMNRKLNYFADKLESYPDHIVSYKEMNLALHVVLSQVLVVKAGISSGRLGDISRDMVIGSYNEKAQESESSKEKFKDFLNQ